MMWTMTLPDAFDGVPVPASLSSGELGRAGALRVPPVEARAAAALPRLFTASLRVVAPGSELRMFHACHATSHAAVRSGLIRRIGVGQAYAADIREGVDVGCEIALRLVGLGILTRLAQVGDMNVHARPLAAGGVIHVVECASLGTAAGQGPLTWSRSTFGR